MKISNGGALIDFTVIEYITTDTMEVSAVVVSAVKTG
jgi:hypothetical protein